ncbi:hypothetical protein GGF43_004280, partial [Coemansia sp. RSA 2618]
MAQDDNDGASPQSPAHQRQSPSPEPTSRAVSPQNTFLTGSSQLPIRTSSGGRSRLASARAAPYTLAQSPRYLPAGDIANIPRTAQFHAVGMPARHPLGVQLESMQSDASTDSADSTSDHGATAAAAAAISVTAAPTTMESESPTTPLSSEQESSAIAPEEDDDERMGAGQQF